MKSAPLDQTNDLPRFICWKCCQFSQIDSQKISCPKGDVTGEKVISLRINSELILPKEDWYFFSH